MLTLLLDEAPARLIQDMTEEQFFGFCRRNKGLRIEREASGEVLITPPAGFEWGGRNFSLSGQLWQWSESNDSGRGFDSSSAFRLASGAVRSADAGWISKERLESVAVGELAGFPQVCPEFVIELTAPDRLAATKAKMCEWIENGVLLGWLIEPQGRQVQVYAFGCEPSVLESPKEIHGAGPIEGFTLKLEKIWSR